MHFERALTNTEEQLLEMVHKSAKRHGFNIMLYLSGIPEEVLRRQAKLKQAPNEKNQSFCYFLTSVV